MKKKVEESGGVEIAKVQKGYFNVSILGTSPFIANRMSEKAKHELLLPANKTRSERGLTLKHNPIAEFGSSFYKLPTGPTLIGHLSSAFKKAACTAALDIPGAKKAQIGRLLYVEGDYVCLYGVPQIFSSIVRSADIAKTPDVRTRLIIPEWACRISVTYVMPILNQQSIVNLIGAAGLIAGVGDWRGEKGSGNYGQFSIVNDDDSRLVKIIAEGGRDAQADAVDNPTAYDEETRELLEWFDIEIDKRKKLGKVAA